MGMIVGNGHRDAKATALTHKLAVVYSRLFAHRIIHITCQPLHIFPAQSIIVCVAVPADVPWENKQTEVCSSDVDDAKTSPCFVCEHCATAGLARGSPFRYPPDIGIR